MKVYFTISGFRALCETCVVNGHNLIAWGETPTEAPPDVVCDCNCHHRLNIPPQG